MGVISFAGKVFRIFKNYGINGVKSAVDASVGKVDVISFYEWIVDETEIPLNEEEKRMEVSTVANWIIPEIGVGSGGHMNIFRFISFLEKMGIHNRIYLYGSSAFDSDKSFSEFLKKYYGSVLNNDAIEAYCSTQNIKYSAATIATGWQTAYFVKRFNNTEKKFYFVQDFEPAFFPMGSMYIFAENTYKFGFDGITAGDWLKKRLHDEYGMKTRSFSFSYDKDVYKPVEKRDDVKRLFFYARPVTPRRSFEIGLLALNEVYKRINDIEVVFAGWDVGNYEIPFKNLNAGSVDISELSDLYAQCDICLVMSTSNLSLLPLEIMASNSVVATSYGFNNEWLVNEDIAIMFNNDVHEISNKIIYYLEHRDELKTIRENGLKFAQNTNWENEAKKVYEIITGE